MHAVDEDRAIAGVVSTLRAEFPNEAMEVIAGGVRRAYAAFDGAPIRDFVPVFVARQVRTVLRRPEKRTTMASSDRAPADPAGRAHQ
jgi:hypothetical protein